MPERLVKRVSFARAGTNEHAHHRALLGTPLPRSTSVSGDGTEGAAGQDDGGALQRRGTCVFSCRLLFKNSLPDCAGALGQTCSLASSEASKKEAPKAETGGPPMKRPACSNKRAASSSAMPGKSDAEVRPPALRVTVFGQSLLQSFPVGSGQRRTFQRSLTERVPMVQHKDSSAVFGNKG